MNHTETLDLLTEKMIYFNRNDPKRIQHFIKVHRFAQLIGRMEKLDAHTQFITECAALVHDIGIRPAEEKIRSLHGKTARARGTGTCPQNAGGIIHRCGGHCTGLLSDCPSPHVYRY